MDLAHMLLLLWTMLIFYVIGQIWIVQIVVYPLFAKVGEVEYQRYHRFYAERIPLPVIAPGFASFLAPIALPWFGPASVPAWMYWTNLGLGVTGLAVTVLLEIPRHKRLGNAGKDAVTIDDLIRYNWPRTASISAQATLSALMLAPAFAPV